MRAGEAPTDDRRSAASRWIRRSRCGGTSRSSASRHEAVAEPVADRRRLEHAEGDGPVEVLERLGVGQAGEGDELVAVERRAGRRHALQQLAGVGGDPGHGGGVDRCHPRRSAGGVAGELQQQVRVAGGDADDVVEAVVGAGGDVGRGERTCRVVGERPDGEVEHGAAPERGGGRRVGRRRAAGQQQQDPRVGEGAGEVVQQPDGGVVGVVDVVDRQHRARRRAGEPEQLGDGDEQPLVRAVAVPRRVEPGEHAVDLGAIDVGDAVEQRGVATAEVGDGVEHRGVGPCAVGRRPRSRSRAATLARRPARPPPAAAPTCRCRPGR